MSVLAKEHRAGVYGNDTTGYHADCMTCGPLMVPSNPIPLADAEAQAQFHYSVWVKF